MSPQAVIDHPSHAPRNGQGSAAPTIVVHDAGLTVKAYRGDGCVLIAMDMDRARCEGLAGFAIARSTDGESFTYAPNRLSFKPHKAVTASTPPEVRHANAEPSNVAPYQKFHWVDYPPENEAEPYHYRVEAMYFVPGKDPASAGEAALRVGASLTFMLALGGEISTTFKIGFTRGYISSQAFADRYPAVRALRPDNSVTYRTLDVVPADLYGRAFDEAWNDMSTFASAEIATQWFRLAGGHGLPRFDLSFAPHKIATVSLARVSQAIRSAKSSVLFAVMELGGGGNVLAQLRAIQQRARGRETKRAADRLSG
jgi:hypothetical protein